jgi:DNA-binding response OmpR family regulator
MKRILIVEDEQHLADGLRFNLEAEGYEALTRGDAESGLEAVREGGFDAIVLDVMLPGISGFDAARQIREAGDHTPILMLTARGRSEDVLSGFEAGADDYLAKPFELSIFLARLNGLLRRRAWNEPEKKAEVHEINGRTVDLGNLELRLGGGSGGSGADGGEVVQLTLMEAKLLRYLISNEGTAVSRKAILEEVWGLAEDTDTRAIDNFIVRLRRHLEDEPNNPQILQTVRGIGYRFMSAART